MSHTARPPWFVNAEPTEAEIERYVKAYKVDARLSEMHGHREDTQQMERLALLAEIKPIVDADPDWAINYVRVNPDGSKTITRKVMGAAPPELRLLLAQDPWLCTGLQWKHIAMDGRMEICSEFGLDTDILLAEDIREVLPEDTDTYLEAWQRLVNDGTVWNVSGVVGRRARALIELGYLLEAPERTEGTWNNGESRHDVPAGMPGSAAFVRAMMGDTYLAWIEAVR